MLNKNIQSTTDKFVRRRNHSLLFTMELCTVLDRKHEIRIIYKIEQDSRLPIFFYDSK